MDILRVAAGDGRLAADELDQRLEAALSARTYCDLAALTADLPRALIADLPTAPGRPAGIPPHEADLVRMNQRFFRDVTRTGRWVVPRRMEIRLLLSNVKLDFTDSVVAHDSLHIDVDLRSGGHLILITRPGIVVEVGDLTLSRGHIRVRPGTEWCEPDIPIILRVQLAGRVCGGSVVARLPRPGLGQRLRSPGARTA